MGAATDDTFRILIATDNHLGFAEKDPERSEYRLIFPWLRLGGVIAEPL